VGLRQRGNGQDYLRSLPGKKPTFPMLKRLPALPILRTLPALKRLKRLRKLLMLQTLA
jgi:hypothetical protein